MLGRFASFGEGSVVGAGAVVLALLGACGFQAGTASRDGGGGAAGSHNGGASGNRDAGSSGSGDRVPGGPPLGDAACAVQTQKAMQVPLDLYVMMDSSGSMADVTASGQSKWDAVRAAMTAFIGDPQSAGLGVGLQYFPLLNATAAASCEVNGACGAFGPCDLIGVCSADGRTTCRTVADCGGRGTCDRLGACGVTNGFCAPAGAGRACSATLGDSCDPIPGYCRARDVCDAAAYATAAVEVAPLPGARQALATSLAQHEVDGLTPTAGALSGAITHAQALARANPGRRVAVLLATDGFPTECDPVDITGVAAIASRAAAAAPSISTFVIGVFSPDEVADARANLDALAAAGGTGSAFVIDTNQNVNQMFLAALNSVRNAGLSCQYKIPAAPAGGTLDYFAVNVQFTAGNGQAVTIGNAPSRDGCSATNGGWYYDVDPKTGTPQNIILCDASCNAVKADGNGRVDVLLGCKTEIVVP